jgi:hypothetical protein
MTTYEQIKQEREGKSRRYDILLGINLFTCLSRRKRRDQVRQDDGLGTQEDLASTRHSAIGLDGKDYEDIGVHPNLPFDEQVEKVRRHTQEVLLLFIKCDFSS